MSAHMVPIGEVVDFIGGGTPSRDVDLYWNGSIPWASVKDFKGPSIDSTLESITHEGLSASSSALIPAGHVIMPTRMALGKAAINSIDIAINQDLKALKPKVRIDTRYLLHAILSRAKEIQSHGKGATVQGITIERLRAIQIPLPPLEEQRRIAAILDKAQDLLLRARLSNQLALSLIESEMIQRFDRPGRVQSQSALLTLVDAGVTVIDCPHSTPQWAEDGKICLRTSNLGKGDWIWQDTRRISDDDFLERSRRAPVEPGDIILSREGTVGIAAIVTSDMEVCMGQRLVQLKLDTRRLMPEYLLAQLLYLLKPQRISHAMTGSTSKHINVKDLRELKVHCPPIEEQLDFENFCKSAKKLRSTIAFLGQKSDMLSRSIQMASFKS